jgi:hypothetical protein
MLWQTVHFVNDAAPPHDFGDWYIPIWQRLRGREVELGPMVPREEVIAKHLRQLQRVHPECDLCDCTQFFMVRYYGISREYTAIACRRMLEMD